MPVVTCPKCSARLNAPVAAAGKRVKCPKCKNLLTVPGAFEVVDDDTPPPKPSRDESDDAPKKKPRVAPPVDDSDEETPRKKRRTVVEDEDDEDERPRKKKNSPLLPILIGVGVLGFLVVAGGIYYLVTPGAPVPLGTTGPGTAGPSAAANVDKMPGITLPQGWVEFNDPRNEIRLFWPKGQPTKGANPKIEDAGGKDFEMWMQESNGKVYTLVRSTLPDREVKPGAEAAVLETTAKGMLSAIPGASEVRKSTEVEGGNPYRVSTIDVPSAKKRIFVRMTLVKNRLIILTITASNDNNMFWAVEGDTAPFFQSLWPK